MALDHVKFLHISSSLIWTGVFTFHQTARKSILTRNSKCLDLFVIILSYLSKT